jgi:hypothetical protein
MGGGSSAGAVDYPDYMKAAHEDWLTQSAADSIEDSITGVMNTALGGSPWGVQLAYDPDADIAASQAMIDTFAATLAGMSDTVDWAALVTQAITSIGAKYSAVVADKAITNISEANIVAAVSAFEDVLDDELTTRILPRFRRGMQDINAVVSSAFPIGEAVLEAFKNRDVAKFESDLRLKKVDVELEIEKANLAKDISVAEMNLRSDLEYEKMYLEGSSQMLRLMVQRIAWLEGNVRTTIEANRIKIVAKKEENDVNMEIDKDDALWDLEVFQYGANLLAGISGGTAQSQKPSKAASAIGGAMSGASTGAMIGSAIPGLGTVAGGIIGGAAGLLGGLF